MSTVVIMLLELLSGATPYSIIFSIIAIVVTAYLAQQLYYLCDFLILRPYSIYSRLTAQGIPADPFIPVIGQAYSVYKYANSDRMVEMALDAERKYGTMSVTTIGPFTVLDCSDPEYISQAWKQDNDKYDKGPFTKGVLGPIIGDGGLILADEPIHTRNRKMIAVAFQHAQLSAMVNIMTQQTSNALKKVANAISPRRPEGFDANSSFTPSSGNSHSPSLWDAHSARTNRAAPSMRSTTF